MLSRTRHRGVVLPIVLLISAMMLATSAAWFETSLAACARHDQRARLLASFHAADSALTLCARSVIAAGLRGVPERRSRRSRRAGQWKLETAFEAGAVTPVAQWPGSLRAPQCLIEAWRLSTRADARAYLLTSRGFGRDQRVAGMAADGTGDRRREDRTSLAAGRRQAVLTGGRMREQYTSAFHAARTDDCAGDRRDAGRFAVPSYRSHVARTHRIDAASALYRAAQFVEGAASDACRHCRPGLDQAPQFGTRDLSLACAAGGRHKRRLCDGSDARANPARCATTRAARLHSMRQAHGATEARATV